MKYILRYFSNKPEKNIIKGKVEFNEWENAIKIVNSHASNPHKKLKLLCVDIFLQKKSLFII